MGLSLYVLLALASTAPGAEAAASATSPDGKAATLAHRSIAEYNGGDFEQALVDMKRAYTLHPGADLLFDLAQCQRAMHHWEQAEFFFRGYLRELPNCRNRPVVEALVGEMEQHRLDELAARQTASDDAALVVVPLEAETVLANDVPAAAVEAPAPRRRVPATAWVLGATGLGIGIAGAIAWGFAGVDRSGYTGTAGAQPITLAQFNQANTAALFGNVLVPVGAVLLATGAGFALFGSAPRPEAP